MGLPLLPARRRLLLELDLTRPVLEAPPASPVGALRAGHAPTLRTVVEALDRASRDDGVAGLVAHLGSRQPTLARSGELRAAVQAFARSGKPAVCWAESYGEELGAGSISYHLASAFGEVWLQPSGGVGLLGLSAEAVFLRGALDRLGVQPQVGQRHEYKTAANTFVETGMTEAHREMLSAIVESATSAIVADIATARSLDERDVRHAMDAAPLPAEQALRLGLVDRLGYRDEVYAELRNRLGDVEKRFVERYGKSKPALARLGTSLRPGRKPVIGVVHAVGTIHLGRSGRPSPLSSRSVGSDTLSAALRAAAEDDAVKAVVLRIDSPGGSYAASDAIRRQVLAVRREGTPVVASMGDVAASGGYFIAMPADAVVASAGTLTGSIGVLAGKQVVQQTLDRVGVHRESVASAAHADMFSSRRPFDEEEWRRLQDWLDRVYDDFTAKVAEDRRMPLERVRDVARGRVWTGADAVRIGLVDELGGLSHAIELACARVGVQRAGVDVRSYPKVSPLQRLLPPSNSDSVAGAAASTGAFGLAGVLHRGLVDAGLAHEGALTMPVTVRLT